MKKKNSSAQAEESQKQRAYREVGLQKIELSNQKANSIFRKWLRANMNRFSCKIIAETVTSNNIPRYGKAYRFIGLCEEIYFTLSPQNLMVHFDLNGTHYDIMCDFEVYPAIDASGKYVCRLCVDSYRNQNGSQKIADALKPGRPKYFDTIDGLYENHCFEPFVFWAQKNIRKNRIIIYEGEPGLWREAEIRPLRDVLNLTKPHWVVPLIKTHRNKIQRII